MEGIQYRRGSTRVVVDREGIAIHRFWRGSKALPWELIDRVGVAKWPWSQEWAIHVELVDGQRMTLPVPLGHPNPGDWALRGAEADILRVRSEAAAARGAGEPADEVPHEYRAVEAGRLAYSGGGRRNGVLLGMIAAFGLLLGLFAVGDSATREFGSLSPAFQPTPCSTSASGFVQPDHRWCAFSDGYVHEIDHPSNGGLTIWLGPVPAAGQDPQADVQMADFATVAPALASLRVGDHVDYIAEEGTEVTSVSIGGKTYAAQDRTLVLPGTLAGQRLAEQSGLVAVLCWPLFFGLWAARQRYPGRLRRAHWLLPVLAACWLAAMGGFLTGGTRTPAPMAGQSVSVAAVLAVLGLAGYAAVRAFRRGRRRHTVALTARRRLMR